jgi:hypothetical protein
MRAQVRTLVVCTLPLLAAVLAAPAVVGQPLPIQGRWKLDEKASRNVSDQAKGIDLEIKLSGKTFSTQRIFDGAPVGDAVVLTLDGAAVEREIAKGQRGTMMGRWIAGGKGIEQTITMKQANFLTVTQTTVTTLSPDGKIMTRVQTTKGGGDTTERVYIYRKKE